MTTKIKCPFCNKDKLVSRRVERELLIDGAPSFVVPDVPVNLCEHCGEETIGLETAAVVDRNFLEQIFAYYSSQADQMPGRVATWVRKQIGVSAKALAEESGIDNSTLSQANTKNTVLDRFTATILLLKCLDYLRNGKRGQDFIERLGDLKKVEESALPVAVIVAQIKREEEEKNLVLSGLKKIRSSTKSKEKKTKSAGFLKAYQHVS
jgi:YgiT-type zinc finger domain-containing protein